jgi:hypothetical protein
MPKIIVNLEQNETITDLVDAMTEIIDALYNDSDVYGMMYSAIEFYNGDIVQAINTLRNCYGMYDSAEDYAYNELDKLYKGDNTYISLRFSGLINVTEYINQLVTHDNYVFIPHNNKVIVAVER